MVFGLLILKEAEVGKMDPVRADHLFHLVAICIVGSIVAHSSTDVLIARWLGCAPKASHWLGKVNALTSFGCEHHRLLAWYADCTF